MKKLLLLEARRQAPRETQPFLDDGCELGISRSAFRRMRKAEKLEAMIGWFHQNFEDPVERTPYETAEGGYQWIWGGPYDAGDELYNKFGDLVSESLIKEAVEEIEIDGLYDWAPVPRPEDYEDEPPPEDEPPRDPAPLDIFSDEPGERYGTAEDHEARRRVQAALEELQRALDTPRPIGIGHNWPSDDDELEEIKELRPAIAELSAELAKPDPTIAFVKRWATPLRSALIACAKWGFKKIDGALDAAVKAGAAGGIGLLATQYFAPLHNAYDAVLTWLDVVAKTLF